MAPEAPSDLPPWRRLKTIIIKEMMIKTISYHCIIQYTLLFVINERPITLV